MLRKFLLAAITVIASAACWHASAQNAGATLEELIAEANAECPQKLDQGSSLEAIRLTDNALETHFVMAIPAAQFPILKQNMDMMRPTLLQLLISEQDTRTLCRMASENGRGLRIIITCRDDRSASFSIDYSAKELADAVK